MGPIRPEPIKINYPPEHWVRWGLGLKRVRIPYGDADRYYECVSLCHDAVASFLDTATPDYQSKYRAFVPGCNYIDTLIEIGRRIPTIKAADDEALAILDKHGLLYHPEER